MALPLCGRRRFAPTTIFPMLQMFEAYAHRIISAKNGVAALRQEAFRADNHFSNASNFVWSYFTINQRDIQVPNMLAETINCAFSQRKALIETFRIYAVRFTWLLRRQDKMMMKAAIQNAFSGNKKAYLVFSFINYMKSDGSHEMLVIRDESTLPNKWTHLFATMHPYRGRPCRHHVS